MSIRIVADGFSFVITDAHSGDVCCRECYARENEPLSRTLVRKAVQSEACQYRLERVSVVIDSNSVCVPSEEFRPEDLQRHYALVYGDVDFKQHMLCYCVLPDLQVVEVFTVPADICAVVSKLWPDATYTNSCSVVLNHTASFCRQHSPEGNVLFAYLEGRQFFVHSISQGQLRYTNHFHVDEKQNALFFLLSVWKELSLDVFHDTCYLGGSSFAQQLADEARAYLRNVKWMGHVDLAYLQ